jgi:exoribonuclease R
MMDIVAEMMIAANAAVANRIAATFPGASLLRNHPPPRKDAFEPVGSIPGVLVETALLETA